MKTLMVILMIVFSAWMLNTYGSEKQHINHDQELKNQAFQNFFVAAGYASVLGNKCGNKELTEQVYILESKINNSDLEPYKKETMLSWMEAGADDMLTLLEYRDSDFKESLCDGNIDVAMKDNIEKGIPIIFPDK